MSHTDPLHPSHDPVPVHPVATDVVAEWPPGTYLENLALDVDGKSWHRRSSQPARRCRRAGAPHSPGRDAAPDVIFRPDWAKIAEEHMVSAGELPPLRGIHHLKFAVSDLGESLGFYERALGARRVPELDHIRDDGSRYAVILEVPGLGTMLELRLDPERAARHALFDPLTIAVQDRAALEKWDAILTERGILHSPILVALQAWLIVVQDPDGNRVRLYTLESHGQDISPTTDSPWIQG